MRTPTLIILAFAVCLTVFAQGSSFHTDLSTLSHDALSVKASHYMSAGKTDSAMLCYAILSGKWETCKNNTDRILCLMAFNEAGKYYLDNMELNQSFDFCVRGTQLAEENGIVCETLCSLYNQLGIIYCMFDDVSIGIEYYEKGLALAQKNGYDKVEPLILKNLTGQCANAGLMDKFNAYNRTLTDKYADKDSSILYFSHFNNALMQINEGNYVPAAESMRKAAEYAHNINLPPRFEAAAYSFMVDIFLSKTFVRDSALRYIRKFDNMVTENDIGYMKTAAYRNWSIYYYKTGNTEKSLEWKVKYLTFADSLYEQERYNKLKNEQFFYEMEQNYQKIKKINDDIARKSKEISEVRGKLLLSVGITLIFLLLSVAVWVQKTRLKTAYQDLFAKNCEHLRMEDSFRKQLAALENKIACKSDTPNEDEKENDTPSQPTSLHEQQSFNYKDRVSDENRQRILTGIERVMSRPEIFCNCDFDIGRLAKLVDSNERYVSQVINETYGKNFRTFINEYRIKEAQHRLLNTEKYGNYTIKAIAESVGYKSTGSFNILFKKQTGITPTIYQQIAKEKSVAGQLIDNE